MGGGHTGEGTRDRLCPCEDGPRGPPPSAVAPVSVTSAGVVWSRVKGRGREGMPLVRGGGGGEGAKGGPAAELSQSVVVAEVVVVDMDLGTMGKVLR